MESSSKMTNPSTEKAGEPRTRPWSELLAETKARPELAAVRAAFLAEARAKLALPLLRRVYRYEDIGQHRTWLDGRAVPLEPEIQTHFALSMSDHASCLELWKELPLLAAAYGLSGEAAFRARVIEQLEEAATWSPLQRSGWCCYCRGSRMPADGKTGSWLATGTGVRAIATTLDIFPAAELPAALRAKLIALLEGEIREIVEDWQVRRQWFVQSHNVCTNQWVLPTEALVRACLTVGKEAHRQAYELGVANLLEAIDVHGPNGEFEEGLHYANFTVLSMLHAAHAMAAAGDRRALERPFLKRFALWSVHHLMPGRLAINAFDAFSAGALPRDHAPMRELLAATAAILEDPFARWALAEQYDGPPADVAGLAAAALPPAKAQASAPLWACYERASRINWRSSWRDDATGLWVRGGHALDQHDHQDRGHVSFILRGRPVLIETGTPAYHHPQLASHFASGAGHNVLQIGLAQVAPEGAKSSGRLPLPGWQKIQTVAPILVRRLDDAGGEARVDGTLAYDGLARWFRNLRWSASELAVTDSVVLAEGGCEVLLFRWHLATSAKVAIEGQGKEFIVRWPGIAMRINGSVALTLAQEERENHSLGLREWDEPTPYPRHTCLLVRTAGPETALTLTTALSAEGL